MLDCYIMVSVKSLVDQTLLTERNVSSILATLCNAQGALYAVAILNV